MSRYAENTSVSTDNSRAEIERTLRRYGASSFAYGWDLDAAQILFVADGRRVRFVLPLPDRAAREFTHTPTRKLRQLSRETEIDACKADRVHSAHKALSFFRDMFPDAFWSWKRIGGDHPSPAERPMMAGR